MEKGRKTKLKSFPLSTKHLIFIKLTCIQIKPNKMTCIDTKRYKIIDYPRRNRFILEKSTIKREFEGVEK